MVDLWMFVGALVVVYLVPGPDMVLMLQTAATQGRSHALAVAAGLALARAAHVLMAALGLGALLKASPEAFEAVRLIGAAYLIWLGIKIFRASSLIAACPTDEPRSDLKLWRASLRKGLLTNISNPKALLFCSVLLPQFIRLDEGGVPAQFVLLGAILVITGLLFDLLYAGAGAALGRWLAETPLVRTLQRWVFATVLIGFGLRMALTGRSS